MTADAAGRSPLEELGRILGEARRKRGWSLEEAAQRTKIPAHHIGGIEAGDFSKMPAHVYARGFIRSYAAALEIHEEPLMQKLDESGIVSATALKRPPKIPAPPSMGPGRVPLRVWLAAAGIIVLGAGIGFGIRGVFKLIKSSGEEKIPPSPFSAAPQNEQKPRSKSGTGRSAAASVSPAAAPARMLPVRASVTATEECWLQIQVDDADPFEVTLAAGESAHWSASGKLRVLIGNSGGVRLASAAGSIRLPREKGRVVHILLTPGGERRLTIPEMMPGEGTSPAVPGPSEEGEPDAAQPAQTVSPDEPAAVAPQEPPPPVEGTQEEDPDEAGEGNPAETPPAESGAEGAAEEGPDEAEAPAPEPAIGAAAAGGTVSE